ncbi:MAG: hypothetical protein HZT40_13040 [Candidatus Thiothrix singaporensis]|uniref:Uncharacterized protein n=1 Tax=Candidatus Thiothrix singaporensis TaxID=2799669 RepID=A0A7L6ATH1_9GAMM|nr:MAG: hypothetical protein HZT40_13040 [Candidatus Thiothrix singaporensis]
MNSAGKDKWWVGVAAIIVAMVVGLGANAMLGSSSAPTSAPDKPATSTATASNAPTTPTTNNASLNKPMGNQPIRSQQARVHLSKPVESKPLRLQQALTRPSKPLRLQQALTRPSSKPLKHKPAQATQQPSPSTMSALAGIPFISSPASTRRLMQIASNATRKSWMIKFVRYLLLV